MEERASTIATFMPSAANIPAIFAADNAAAYYAKALGQTGHVQNRVAIMNRGAIEFKTWRAPRVRARRKHNIVGTQILFFVPVSHLNVVRIDQGGKADVNINAIALQLQTDKSARYPPQCSSSDASDLPSRYGA